METGIVFDIKEFAVFDGPGIRTTVFMKGCPLRCQWCHNPEGLSAKPQLMVSQGACMHCGTCRQVCRHKICTACGACVSVCRSGLRRIVGERWTAAALAERLKKDQAFLTESGGGITFSGGEPLMQWDFISAAIDEMPGMHIAIETSGYASDDVFLRAMAKTGIMLMDIKLTDPEKHKHYTGVDNTPILRHVRMLREGDTPFIIRIPVIPGVNDDREHFNAVADLIAGAKHLVRVELLPYHKTAGAKYEMVNLHYTPDFDESSKPNLDIAPFVTKGIDTLVM